MEIEGRVFAVLKLKKPLDSWKKNFLKRDLRTDLCCSAFQIPKSAFTFISVSSS